MDLNLSVMALGATTGITYAIDRTSKSKGGKGGRIITTASVAGLVVSIDPYSCDMRRSEVTTSFSEISTTRQQPGFWGLFNSQVWKYGPYKIIPQDGGQAHSLGGGHQGLCPLPGQ